MIAILGPGGVGGFLAAALARASARADPHRAEAVTVVAREPTAEAIATAGITVQSVRLGDFTAHPSATGRLKDPTDTLIIATKATGLEAALERIDIQPDLVVPLLNGLDHMTALRDRFDPRTVAAGAIRIEATRPRTGHITQTSRFLRIDLASDDPALHDRLTKLKDALEQADVPAEIGPSESQILWAKLVRLNAIACTTSACAQSLGFIRSDPEWRRALAACVNEAAAVANAEGARIDPAAPMAELGDAHAELVSSMARDIEAGREPELDAIPGAVVRAANRHQLPTPTIKRLSVQIAARADIPTPAWARW